jgi:hypothetical protein
MLTPCNNNIPEGYEMVFLEGFFEYYTLWHKIEWKGNAKRSEDFQLGRTFLDEAIIKLGTYFHAHCAIYVFAFDNAAELIGCDNLEKNPRGKRVVE